MVYRLSTVGLQYSRCVPTRTLNWIGNDEKFFLMLFHLPSNSENLLNRNRQLLNQHSDKNNPKKNAIVSNSVFQSF